MDGNKARRHTVRDEKDIKSCTLVCASSTSCKYLRVHVRALMYFLWGELDIIRQRHRNHHHHRHHQPVVSFVRATVARRRRRIDVKKVRIQTYVLYTYSAPHHTTLRDPAEPAKRGSYCIRDEARWWRRRRRMW